MKGRWLTAGAAGVLVLPLLVGVSVLSVDLAAADTKESRNPLFRILHKLDDVIALLSGASSTAWDKKITTPDRFTVLAAFNGEVVRDNETGLLWEQSPSSLAASWESARHACSTKAVGERMGWRLPSVQELASLVDPFQSEPALPLGHPFANIELTDYWSATTDVEHPAYAWDVFFGGNPGVGTKFKSDPGFAWCVRGATSSTQY